MSIVTLSRQLGSGGDEIAARVAGALGLRLVDAETINHAAAKAGVPQQALEELEHEGGRGLAAQVLKALRAMPSLPSPPAGVSPPAADEDTVQREPPGLTIPFAGLFSPTVPPISASMETHVHMVGLVIRGLAREGNLLIVGRGGQVLLRKYPCAVHMQVVAPLNQRIEAVMRREELDWRSAQSRVRASDRARSDYLRRYHGVNWMDATLYHLVINTGKVPIEVAVDLIVALQRTAIAAPAGEPAHDQ